MARGKYLKQLGNTPGHIQHWSKRAFGKMLTKNNMRIIGTKTPFPWTMVLITKREQLEKKRIMWLYILGST